jgi:hypothetical protein
MLAALNSIDTGAHIANRFAKLKDLPEHPLVPPDPCEAGDG